MEALERTARLAGDQREQGWTMKERLTNGVSISSNRPSSPTRDVRRRFCLSRYETAFSRPFHTVKDRKKGGGIVPATLERPQALRSYSLSLRLSGFVSSRNIAPDHPRPREHNGVGLPRRHNPRVGHAPGFVIPHESPILLHSLPFLKS